MVERVPRVIGPMTIERYSALLAGGLRVRVLANGEDVTGRCFYADDTPGAELVRVFQHNEHGRAFVDPSTGAAAVAEFRGAAVRFEVRCERHGTPIAPGAACEACVAGEP